MAFQSKGRSRAETDWVTVCSSTFMAMAVIHSAKRRYPQACEIPGKAFEQGLPHRPEQCSVRHGESPVSGPNGLSPPGWFRPRAAAFNRACLISGCAVTQGNYA